MGKGDTEGQKRGYLSKQIRGFVLLFVFSGKTIWSKYILQNRAKVQGTAHRFLLNSSLTTFDNPRNSKYRINKVEVLYLGGNQITFRAGDILQKQQKCTQLSCLPDCCHVLSTPGKHLPTGIHFINQRLSRS